MKFRFVSIVPKYEQLNFATFSKGFNSCRKRVILFLILVQHMHSTYNNFKSMPLRPYEVAHSILQPYTQPLCRLILMLSSHLTQDVHRRFPNS